MLDFFHRHQRSIKNDTLSGLTVALALAISGRPGMISAATGAMAVVIVTLVSKHGLPYLFPTVMLCGLVQVGVGHLVEVNVSEDPHYHVATDELA
jgi:SulP family sulfate permease